MSQFFAPQNFSTTHLGAGDLIDRAVRFYRHHFWTFVLIAAPPVIVGTLISVGWIIVERELFSTQSYDSFDRMIHALFVWFGSILIWLTEMVATLAVMGGASRNFVRHLLFGEPIKFKETYRNTWKRLPGLIFASTIISVLFGVIGIAAFYFGLTLVGLSVAVIALVFSFSPFIIFVLSVIAGLTIILGTLWLFFLVASRFAYVPQVMLVESQGVFAAIGRSASLASGNVKPLAALVIFTMVASYSAILLFYVPLLWAAWVYGVDPFNAETLPAWYLIANQIVWQASFILLMPVWMIGLCLLYVDERVRKEGYDIELLAAQRLGEIPVVPQNFVNPLQPALATQTVSANIAPPRGNSNFTTLGLK